MISPNSVGVKTQLNISNARVEDGGLYACVAVVAETSVSHVARLDVYGKNSEILTIIINGRYEPSS